MCVCVACNYCSRERRAKLFTLNPVSRVLHTKSNQSVKEDGDKDHTFQKCALKAPDLCGCREAWLPQRGGRMALSEETKW